MTKRKVEIIAALTVLLLLVVFVLWLLLRQPRTETPEQPEQNIATDDLPPIDPAEIPQQNEVAAATVGRIFVERFGSYSSESDFANVDDVMSLATDRFQRELQGLVTQYRASTTANQEYSGISTFVITTKTLEVSETNTSLLITTQRKEAVGNPGNASLRYQDVELALVKVDDAWLVDSLQWR